MLYDQSPQPPLPEGWFFRILIAFAALMRGFGALLAMITSSILFVYPFEPFLRLIPMPRLLGQNLLQGIPFLIMSLLITWILLRYVHKSNIRELGIEWNRRAIVDFLWAFSWGVVVLALTVLPLLAAGAGRFAEAQIKIRGPYGLFVLLTLLLFAAGSEELIMRGYAFQSLIQPLHLLGALVATSGVFAAIHSNNPGVSEYAIANTFLAGCVLGMVLAVRRSLWAAVGAHFAWNIATVCFGLNVSGLNIPITPYSLEWTIDPLWTGGRYGPEGGLVCTIVLSLTLFLLVNLYYRQQSPTPAARADAE